ncbi:MAG: hypothetical protein LUE93_01940 [Bacteroides sp.]|nr:hypothetical protein [Bacteroides sp.]
MKRKYAEKAQESLKLIEFALNALDLYGKEEWNPVWIGLFRESCLAFRDSILLAPEEEKNLRSLTWKNEQFFNFINMFSGEAVNRFWQRVREEELPFERRNMLLPILKRKKIETAYDYDMVSRSVLAYFQEGLINEEEVVNLYTYMKEYEEQLQEVEKEWNGMA